MLPGSWWKAANPATTTRGTILLEAQYDYAYQGADGRQVQIWEGETFVLLRKANEDWWQVQRLHGPPKAKPIYVPAAYVTQVSGAEGVARGQRAAKPFCRSMEDLNSNGTEGCRMAALTPRGSFLLPPSQDLPVERSSSSSVLPQNPYQRAEGGPPCTFPPQRGVLEVPWRAGGLKQPSATQSTLLDSHLYSNLQDLKRWQSEPPSPTQDPIQLLDLWAQHLDPSSGRYFYVNTVTGERSWKPPRRSRQRAADWSRTLPGGPLPSDIRHLYPNGQKLQRQDLQRAASSTGLAETPSEPLSWCGALADRNGNKMVLQPSSPSQQSLGSSSVDKDPDSSDSSTPELEKAGPLNKTKVAEGGRKLRKNWSSSWVVLVGNSLMFFKDPKAQTPTSWKPGHSKPESSIDLRGAQLHWVNDMSSRKNVFWLRTVTGNEFLLQSDTETVIREWFSTLHGVIERLERENPIDNISLYSLRRSGSSELLDGSGDEDDTRWNRKASLTRSVSNVENSEKKRVKSRLKRLIQKRPPLQALQEKGLIKDQVFGCRLDALCQREKTMVPKFVRMCAEAVESRGLDCDGIYRVSGNIGTIQKLRFIVDHERAVTSDGRYLFPAEQVQEEKLNLDDSQWEDIHVITGALKMFFRELPEPLVPYDLFDDFVESVKIPDYQERVKRIKWLIDQLPEVNYHTMRFIFRHLRRVMQHQELNRMSVQNIGIVFGPTLLRPEKDFGNIAVSMVYQNQVVELILSECEQLFEPQ
ncbi:rho GTPase-activating protein 15 [Polypterus senegalus]|uniref:rho GTPase-activating protein 15 n=1 Tax=Polypterus senegalus TaxID=55291 RepID=UPI001965195E|nr:rho GTPase-activating protein 15 [Polypterus senegalus]